MWKKTLKVAFKQVNGFERIIPKKFPKGKNVIN